MPILRLRRAVTVNGLLPLDQGWETIKMTTKAELVTAIAEKSGLNKNQAKDALEAFTAGR